MVAAAIGAIGSIGGALISSSSASDAANAQQQSNEAAIAEQRREFDAAQARSQPWVTAGTGALAQMGQLNAGDFSSFHQSPDYQWALSQGIAAQDASAASRGRLDSGGYGMDLTKFGQGLAEQNYGQYYNRLESLAGLGQQTVSGINSLGAGAANQIGQFDQSTGLANASGYTAQGNIWGNALGQLGGLFSQQSHPSSSSGSYTGAINYGSPPPDGSIPSGWWG